MKAAFNFASWRSVSLALAMLTGACVDFEDPQGNAEETSGGDGASTCTDDCHDLTGEVMLIINSRLPNPDTLYQTNIPTGDEGVFVGPDVFLYDPLRSCDDGTHDCRVVKLGHLLLDERLGVESVEDGSLGKLTLRDLAWSEDRGLWGISYDSQNDEWGLAELDVTDWYGTNLDIAMERWVLKPGDPAAADTDPCYWQESVSGLAFAGEHLLVGVRGAGGVGIAANGGIYSVDFATLEDGHCIYQNDPSQDDHYYACASVCVPWAQYPELIGVAGDMEVDGSGQTVYAVTRSESEALLPLDRQALFEVPMHMLGDVPEPVDTQLFVEPVAPGLDIEGLARIGDRMFGVDVLGRVYEFDFESRTVQEHDDIADLLASSTDALKVRGATRVVLP